MARRKARSKPVRYTVVRMGTYIRLVRCPPVFRFTVQRSSRPEFRWVRYAKIEMNLPRRRSKGQKAMASTVLVTHLHFAAAKGDVRATQVRLCCATCGFVCVAVLATPLLDSNGQAGAAQPPGTSG